MTTRATNERALRRLEAAFACLAEIYRRGGHVTIERGTPTLVAGSGEGWATLERRLRELKDAAHTLLTANRKDWAKDKREIVLAVAVDEGGITELAALELIERRVIGRALGTAAPDAAMLRRLKVLFADATGVVVAAPAKAERGAIGLLLADLEAGRGRLELTEVGNQKESDYRNYLAGSAWLDMRVRVDGDLAAQAVLTALQVRSMRRDALRSVKQGYYTAIAADMLTARGESFAGIQKRLNVPADTLRRWLKSDLSAPPPATRPPSEGQATFIRDILADLPFLDIFLEPSWRTDATAAKAFLDRVGEHQSAWRTQMREIRRLAALRQSLGAGASLEEACRASGITAGEAPAALQKTPAVLAAALAASIEKVVGRAVDVPIAPLSARAPAA